MNAPLSTEQKVGIVEQLRFLRVTAKFKYAKDEFYMVGKVMHDAAAEIERLEREKAEWSGIAAQRNRTNALLADDRDTERTKRLQAEHERDCAVEKLAELRADAVETVSHWGAYASSYFQEKHDLAGDIARLRGASPDVGTAQEAARNEPTR